MGKKDLLSKCLGTVTILTDDLVIFQGQIQRDDEKRHHDDEKPIIIKTADDEEFITLRLECVPVLISVTGAALHFVTLPIYQVNDVIEINVEQIISVGPNSIGCLDNGVAAG